MEELLYVVYSVVYDFDTVHVYYIAMYIKT